ncbi:acylphosphatase [Chryseosolibacter indicus]|uniref:acylphosphatase n=1 Tax=Chryseosolibacter indicus TaxID=2782351 RepID=A0ABS5VKK2_9BACT|nr:acylphosphatase [Chryseosolibacter indicus]MBT1701980.1 acylphosphatase [Chryseosolibacter indicus]
MIKSVSIQVTGKVQGVFFRASTKEKADELGAKGIVRNEADGSVYIEAEGEVRVVDTFIDWCKKGPPRAKVNECLVKDIPLQNFKDFTIQR